MSMKYPFPLVILMWVYLLLPFLLLNELCISAVIRDLSRLCGIDVYKVEKSGKYYSKKRGELRCLLSRENLNATFSASYI